MMKRGSIPTFGKGVRVRLTVVSYFKQHPVAKNSKTHTADLSSGCQSCSRRCIALPERALGRKSLLLVVVLKHLENTIVRINHQGIFRIWASLELSEIWVAGQLHFYELHQLAPWSACLQIHSLSFCSSQTLWAISHDSVCTAFC